MLDSKFPGLKPQTPDPNPFDTQTDELKKAVDPAKDILVLICDNPKLDHVSSALGLYLALKASGKSVTIASPTPMRVEFNRLVGVNKITQNIGNRNLVVSFPYVKDSIEKVSYNVNEATFNLVIQPKPGFPSLKSDKIEYSYSGSEADVVFTIGAQKLEDLGVFFQAERPLFDKATLVNIDSIPTNTKFAQINLVWNQVSSSSEVVSQLIERLGLTLDADIATNLLAGLNEATQNFQRLNVKPNAFEIASKLMQAGGKRPLGSTGGVGAEVHPSSRLGAPRIGLPPHPQATPSPFLGTPPAAAATTNPLSTPPSISQTQPPQQFPQSPLSSSPQFSQAAPSQPPATSSLAAMPQPTHAPSPTSVGSTTTARPISSQPQIQPQPKSQQPNMPPQPTAQPFPTPSSPQPQPQVSTNSPDQKQTDQSVKDDWLKPKIYKGSTKI